MNLKGIVLFATVALFYSCVDDSQPMAPLPPTTGGPDGCAVGGNGWTIPLTTVADGGVGKDGIASIEDPNFISVDEVDFLTDRELVVALKVGDDIRVYPQRILDQHEIVNDDIGGQPISVTFCPLTGTAIAFERTIDGVETTLGVSGLLFNNNLIVYDRFSDTRWSQMTFEGLQGPFSCERLRTYPVVELSWSALRRLHPEASVLSKDTGFDKRYANEPLSVRTPLNSLPAFPYEPIDTRLPNYLRVHLVRDSVASMMYPIDGFDDFQVVIDNSVIIIADPEAGMIVSYEYPSTVPIFTPVVGRPEVIMSDNAGNEYNIFGEVVAGPDVGETLQPTTSYMGYWFAMGAMFPNSEIFVSEADGG